MVDLESVDGYPEKVEDCYGQGSYFVYILRVFDDRWYIGQTEAPKRRIIQHINGATTSTHWMRQHPPVAIEWVLEFDTREETLERER